MFIKDRFPLNPGSVKYRFYCNCLHTGLRIVKDDSLWDMSPCSLVEVSCFRDAYTLLHHCPEVGGATYL
jgi:hypothetical protein